jgi:hypothetical protein
MKHESRAAPQILPGFGRVPPWAEALVRALDDGIMIPGTRIGVGLDSLLGFVFPVLGDATTGVASLALLLLALRMRVPRVVIWRIVFNIGIDVLIGCVPLIGDAFFGDRTGATWNCYDVIKKTLDAKRRCRTT